MNRTLRFLASTAGAACSALLLAACGGGGSGSTPHVNVTPTPSGSPPPAVACTNSINIQNATRRQAAQRRHTSSVTQSTYTFDSNPRGLLVYINGNAVGTTAFSTTPPFSNTPDAGVIRGPQSDYDVCFSQLMDGNHTVFFNTAADTRGRLGTIASALVPSSRYRSHLPPSASLGRVPPRRHGAAGVDRLRIQVRFSLAAIRSDERVAASIERSEGALRAQTMGPTRDGTLNRIVWLPPGSTPESFAARFRKHAEVVDARPLPLRYAQSSTPKLPNDPLFDPVDQWDMYHISTPNAWGYTTGSRSIAAAIIDTGADLTQPDLAPQPGLGAKITYEVRWVANEPPYPDTNPGAAQDYDGHGTNVSGIAGADTDNSFGFAGAGYNVALQIYRIFPTNAGQGASVADEASAIHDAIAHHARVINLSLGSCAGQGSPPGPDPTEFDAVEAAISSGVVVVAAAGNERSGQGGSGCSQANTIDFPAAYPGVISVGATSLHDGGTGNPVGATEYVASYSNSGPGLSVVAPGGDPGNNDNDPLHWITNLYSVTGAPFTPGGPPPCQGQPLCAALVAGTSQATPHVTGTVALMLTRNPGLQPPQVKHIIESTADNLNDPNQGHGRLNAYRALAAVVGDTTTLPTPAPNDFVAIAYTVNAGSNRPNILNQTFTGGAPLNSDGTFRLADVPANAPSFSIGLWNDANGDGIVDAGDYFGSVGPCSGSSPCSAAASVNVGLVPPGFVLH